MTQCVRTFPKRNDKNKLPIMKFQKPLFLRELTPRILGIYMLMSLGAFGQFGGQYVPEALKESLCTIH